MFVKILNEVADQINRDYPGRQHAHLFVAINIWCKKLDLNKNETDYINNISRGDEVTELGDYLDEEWKFNFLSRRSKLYDLEVWNVIKRKDENIKFIVLIAFAITAICYFIYKLDKPKQKQTNPIKETITSSNNPSFTVQNSSDKTLPQPPTSIITKQFLVLVVSHEQAGFLELLQAKEPIDFKDGESLYEITKYLWVGSETEYSKIKANISDYSVAKGAESEYDIYLVSIELNQADKGFNSNVDKLDRYDAFHKLADFAVNLTISPRLQMEAYGNIGVYSR
jgi:preprotein translocase subunit YajC